MDLQHLAHLIANSSTPLPAINFLDCLRFIRLCSFAKPTLELQTSDRQTPPVTLPVHIVPILEGALVWNSSEVNACWSLFRGIIWAQDEVAASEDEIRLYNRHALGHTTSYRHIYPPVRVCQNFHCKNHRTNNDILTLGEPKTHKATLFTLREGALPVYTTSLYCRACYRRYYHNYYVHVQGNSRTYYPGVPDCIQVAQHYFIESTVLELFANGMVFGWLSATNCARIYNHTLVEPNSHIRNNTLAFSAVYQQRMRPPLDWQTALQLRPDDVMNGFFLYSVLLEKAERGSTLVLSHDEPRQKDRLHAALEERNKATEGIGQEYWPHACDQCFVVSLDSNGDIGKIQYAVCDGDAIGHWSCCVHDCKVPLAAQNHHFCPEHSYLNKQCAVTECISPNSPGFRTCDLAEHRSLEKAYFKRGDAIFQLRSRLKKAGIAVPPDSVPLAGDSVNNDDEVVIESSQNGPVEVDAGECDGKPEAGNRKLRAYFGQHRTHNEQLIMRPCGIILSRATFFGSEAVSAVNTFAKATFPSPESTREFFIFDNNCKLDAHQKAINDDHFENTGKPVDVFHFKSKHKENDTHCATFCNPAAFPELIKNGKWTVNTSICEQTNVWFGGYLAMVRDMEVTQYNFFLDEMIKRRNRYIVKELEVKGYLPWVIPMSALFPNKDT